VACWVAMGCTMVGAMTKASMFGLERREEMAIMTFVLNGLFYMKCSVFAGVCKCKIKCLNHEGPSIRVSISIHAI
jgi:hypothetical protein